MVSFSPCVASKRSKGAVSVQVVKTYFLRSHLLLAYPATMETPAALPLDIWERTPPEAQAYIRALEGRVTALEGGSRPYKNRSSRLRRILLVRRRAIRHSLNDGGVLGVRAVVAVNRVIRARRVPCSLWTTVDEVVVLKPEQCRGCHARLSGDDPPPCRHQVIEIPPIKPVVTEYQWHQLVCPDCGRDDTSALARRACPVGPTVPGSTPRWRCVRGRIACPNV